MKEKKLRSDRGLVVKQRAKEKTSDLVIQNNYLVEAHYDLTLQEKRVILWLASQTQPDDIDFKEHVVKISDFCKISGLKSKNMHREIEKTTKSLIQRGLSIYYPAEERLLQVAWLNSAEYLYKEGSVRLCFSPKLKPYLLQIKGCYTQISLEQVMLFKSVHSIRLYELLKQYQKLGMREIKIDDLKKFLGIGDKEYELYANLKCKVLNRAKNEINKRSDLEVDFSEVKVGRKVESIKFTIKINQRENSSSVGSISEKKNIISQQSLNSLRQEFDEDVIQQGLDVLRQYEGEIKNPVLFLRSAIQKGWQPFVEEEKKEFSGNETQISLLNEICLLNEDSRSLSFRKNILEKIGEAEYRSWFKDASFSVEEGNVFIDVGSAFIKDWIDTHLCRLLLDCFEGHTISCRVRESIVITPTKKQEKPLELTVRKKKNVSKETKREKEKNEQKVEQPKKSFWQKITSFWKKH